jgi:hypothetical protein
VFDREDQFSIPKYPVSYHFGGPVSLHQISQSLIDTDNLIVHHPFISVVDDFPLLDVSVRIQSLEKNMLFYDFCDAGITQFP